jgi:hypothetical protein
MTDFVYTDSFTTEGTSSVIADVFYNSNNRQLVVALNSGILCGYSDVEPTLFTAFSVTNSARVDDGNTSASVGYYWNTFIKGYKTGFDASDLDLIHVDDVDETPKLDALVSNDSDDFFATDLDAVATDDVGRDDDLVAQAPVADQSESAGTPVQKDMYEVTFDDSETLGVFASSEAEAVKIIRKIADLAGWNAPNVESVTHYF